jgi:hypothetical protein
MVVFGNPALCIPTQIQMKVTRPEKTVYIGDKKVLPVLTSLNIGKITIETTAASRNYEIEKEEFYIDNTLRSISASQNHTAGRGTPLRSLNIP